jgi:PAS domain S-box-containing protein
VPLRDKSGKVVKWYGTNVDIEDRKRAEARISQAETDLRLAMDTIPAVVWSAGPDGSADFVSRGWLEYTNLSLEETKGSGWSLAIHPDDRSKFVDKFLKAIAEGTPYEDEGRIRRADGQYRWFLVRATPFRDPAGTIIRWYGTCANIEDREQKRPFAIVSSAFGISVRQVPIGTGRLGPIIDSLIFLQTAPKPQMWRTPIEFALGAHAGR